MTCTNPAQTVYTNHSEEQVTGTCPIQTGLNLLDLLQGQLDFEAKWPVHAVIKTWPVNWYRISRCDVHVRCERAK